MGLYEYSYKADDRETAKAQAFDLNGSYKDLGQVLRALKGKSVAQARKILEECISLKMPIPYKKFNTGFGHRSQLGGKKGRWPVREAKMALALLNNAGANANFKGLPVEQLIVRQGAAFKQNVMRRYRRVMASSVVLGYGKQAVWANYVTARAEIVLAKGKAPMSKNKQRKAEGKEHKSKAKEHKPKTESKKDHAEKAKA